MFRFYNYITYVFDYISDNVSFIDTYYDCDFLHNN